MNWKKVAPALVIGALGFAATAHSAEPLFLGPTVLLPDASATARRLAVDPTTASLRVMDADPSVVRAHNNEIGLNLGHVLVNAVLEKATSNADGSLIWVGHVLETTKEAPTVQQEVKHDARNSVILLRDEQGVAGSVRVDGQLYRIRPFPGGNHAVTEVNEYAMPPDHPNNEMLVVAVEPPSGSATQVIPSGSNETIRVLVVATDAAVTTYGSNMRSLAKLAIAESNVGYSSSNVGITLELAGYATTPYQEVNFQTDLSRFKDPSDDHMDNIHALRDSAVADIAVLLVANQDYCGIAYQDARAVTAFAAVSWNCATGYYSFAHETGHMLSAHHDPETPSTRHSTPMAMAIAPRTMLGVRSWPTTALGVARV